MAADQVAPHVKKEHVREAERTAPVKEYAPYTDIYETPSALVVLMDMPGVERSDLQVTLDKDQLTIDGEIDYSRYQGLQPLYTEYNVGHFTRSFSLSRRINRDGISAEMHDGVLTLELPKVDEAKPRRVEVK